MIDNNKDQIAKRRYAKPATLNALTALGLPEIKDAFAQFEAGLDAVLRQGNGIPVFIAAAQAVQDDDVLKSAVTPDRVAYAAHGAIDGIYLGSRGTTQNEKYDDFLLCAAFAQSRPDLWRLFTEGGLFAKAITKSVTGKSSERATDICKLADFGIQHDELAEIAKEKFLARVQDLLASKQDSKIIEVLEFAYGRPLWALITPQLIGQIITSITESGSINAEYHLRTIFKMVENDPVRLRAMVPTMVAILAESFINYGLDVPAFMRLANIAESRDDWQLSFGRERVAAAFLNAQQAGKIDGVAIMTQLQNTAPRVAKALARGIDSQRTRQEEIKAAQERQKASTPANRIPDDNKRGMGGRGQGAPGRFARGPGFGPG